MYLMFQLLISWRAVQWPVCLVKDTKQFSGIFGWQKKLAHSLCQNCPRQFLSGKWPLPIDSPNNSKSSEPLGMNTRDKKKNVLKWWRWINCTDWLNILDLANKPGINHDCVKRVEMVFAYVLHSVIGVLQGVYSNYW